MGKRVTIASAFFAALAFSAACGVHQTEAPALTGPSGLSTSIVITATPDSISQDGASQASVTVFVRDANARPMQGTAIRLDMAIGGSIQDFGTLSARTIVTGSDGKAFAIYTAPPPPPPSVGASSTRVQVVVTAIGTNAQVTSPPVGPASILQTVDIRLVPTGIILPPAGTPTAAFNWSPSPVLASVPVTFDASTSAMGAGATQIASYAWSFGDGTTGTGRAVTHTFTTAATYNVTLTVTNDRGLPASLTLPVTVGTLTSSSPTAPTAKFTFSPSAPASAQTVFFNAASSTAGTGHTLASYAWDFGDGSAATGVTPTHAFGSNGTFTVTLSVKDETGQVGVISAPITITSTASAGSAPTATFGFSPAAPAVGETVFFNAGSSTAGAGHTIASYAWTFGDGTLGVGVTPTHAYAAAGSYSVQVKVTDEIGQSTTSAATSITVGNPPAPTSNFTFSPAAPGRFDQVVFDASSSTTAQGQTIVDVAWNFGDGTAVVHCPGDPACVVGAPPTNRVSAHTFATNQTFTVNLVVTDSAGRTGSHNASVTVALADPTVSLTTSPGSPNPGTVVQFNSNNTTYYPGSGPSAFAWTFGDGFGSALANPSHPYAAVGTYTVGLSVTDNRGRVGTGNGTVTVVAVAPPPPPVPPVASFTYGPTSPKQNVTSVLFDGSGSTGSNLTYSWNFGDGIIMSSGAVKTINHTYMVAPGTYSATLTVTDTVTTLSNTSAPQTVTVVP